MVRNLAACFTIETGGTVPSPQTTRTPRSPMNPFRPGASGRPMATRLTLIAVVVALAVSALGSLAFTMALRDTLVSGLVTFAMFGGLAALTAGVLAWEVASSRACPRCGTENVAAAGHCTGCGYDLQARPRYACTEGHRVAYEEGLCECGRRLLAVRPAPVMRHALRAVWFMLAFLLVFVAIGILSTLLGR
jgi:hypothetical protein